MVKERLKRYFNNERSCMHQMLILKKPQDIKEQYRGMLGNSLNWTMSSIEDML